MNAYAAGSHDAIHAAFVGISLLNGAGFSFFLWLVKRHIRAADAEKKRAEKESKHTTAILHWYGLRIQQIESLFGDRCRDIEFIPEG